MELKQSIIQTAKWILSAHHIVIFTGAGISTASGMPDYRGPDGVWTRRDKGLPPPHLKIPLDMIRPNKGHDAIVELEKAGKVQFLISQNVDGLHLESGFPAAKLAELHGNKNLMQCTRCDAKISKTSCSWDDKRYGKGYRTQRPHPDQPVCPVCKSRLISTIVNFGDPLPIKDFDLSVKHSRELCDLFIVLGSSLVVSPANQLVRYAKEEAHAHLIINNMGETPYDSLADMLIAHPINTFFPQVVALVLRTLNKQAS